MSSVKPLRVLHIDTERGWRGGQQQAFTLIEGLRERHHADLAVARAGEPFAKRVAPLIPVLECRPVFEWDPLVARRIRRALRENSVDVVHAHSGHAVAHAALATVGTKIPVVATRRVDFPLAKNPITAWKYRRLARVIAISEEVRRVLIAGGVPEKKIRLVHSGVDFRRYDGIAAVAREQFNLPNDAILIGQIAALAPHKDQQTFFRAIRLLRERGRNAVGAIVGEGPSRGELESAIAKGNLGAHIRLLGFRSDALSYLKAFDIFCLSSKTEGLGTSVIDAMALRVPVVVTRAGGLAELVEEGKTGFTAEPQDPVSLADALERCLNRSDRASLLDQAVDNARKFDKAHMIEGTDAVYRELV